MPTSVEGEIAVVTGVSHQGQIGETVAKPWRKAALRLRFVRAPSIKVEAGSILGGEGLVTRDTQGVKVATGYITIKNDRDRPDRALSRRAPISQTRPRSTS